MTGPQQRSAKFKTASEMARALNIPGDRFYRGIRDGTIAPDTTLTNRIHLFREDREREIASILGLTSRKEILAI